MSESAHDLTTKDGMLAAIAREREDWEALVAEVGKNRMGEPGAMGEWTFKDVVGHLNGWRARTVDRLEAAARNAEPPPPAWPDTLSDEDDAGVDAINAWIFARNQERPADDLLAETRDQFARMAAAVAAAPDAALLDPARYAWMGGQALGPGVLAGSFEHVHEEHEPGLRAWLGGGDPDAS